MTPKMYTPPGIMRDSSLTAGAPTATAAPRMWNSNIPHELPHERLFPIQIGGELFKLSGASLSSDAPSYFSEYFKHQLQTTADNSDSNGEINTLFVDRDPITFKDIVLHLQGYHIAPRDGSHFVKLFADAQFYALPRLISQLFEESIFISIGHQNFQIPRELFSDPGNSPNYFSLGFAVFFTSPSEVFPGLSRDGLVRPPSIIPPSVPNRSAETFSELLQLLRGYPLHIRNEAHRAALIRDCRYFHLKGLEQKLIRHSLDFNPVRNRHEITLRLEDVRQSGISISLEQSTGLSPGPSPSPITASPTEKNKVSYISYARPYIDTSPAELVLEIGEPTSHMRLHFSPNPNLHLNCSSPKHTEYHPETSQTIIRAEFFGNGKTRIAKLFDVIATKLNLPTSQPLGLLMKQGGAGSQPPSPGRSGLSGDLVRVFFEEGTGVVLDGRELDGRRPEYGALYPLGSRKRTMLAHAEGCIGGEIREPWIVKTGQWRLRIQGVRDERGRGLECVLVGVKIDAVSSEEKRNLRREFLGG